MDAIEGARDAKRTRMDDEGNILRSFARGKGRGGGDARERGRRLDEVDGYGRARAGEGLEAGTRGGGPRAEDERRERRETDG